MTILQVGRQLFGAEYFWETNASVHRGSRDVAKLPTGHSDYAGTAHGPTPVYVEAKSVSSPSSARLRPEQIEFLDAMEKRGAFCCVAFDEDPGQLSKAWCAHKLALQQGRLEDYERLKHTWRANYEANLAAARALVNRREAPKKGFIELGWFGPVTKKKARQR